jgi:hypothetical protein
MVNKWLLEDRRDLFIRGMVEKFLEARAFFGQIYEKYKKEKGISFKEMDYWVGTELKKGPLWSLKDECHALFRHNESEIGLCEHFFDWTFGSIFHECMKLKEDIYQIEAYKPVYLQFKQSKQTPGNAKIKEMLEEIQSVIDKVERDLATEMNEISYLFSEAATQLKRLFPNYSQNGLLVRFLVENEKLVDRVLGNGSLREILCSMYPDGFESAYFIAGKNYLDGCWYEKAVEAFKKVLEINPGNIEAKEELDRTKIKMAT